MKDFRCIENGKIYKTDKDENYLNNCPECNEPLWCNRYKNLYVSNIENEENEINIEIAMEFCNKCGFLFIRTDY